MNEDITPPDGRGHITQPDGGCGHEVVLLVRAGCHACAAAEDDVGRICAELGVPWRTGDVDADPELRAEYGDRVPVIIIDGREHGFWKVEEQRLRAALTR